MEGLTDAQIVARIERLEAFARSVADATGLIYDDGSQDVDPDVVQLARDGDRMAAAKLLVERTGLDFVEAQRVVNDL